jgi:hypothetical protein
MDKETKKEIEDLKNLISSVHFHLQRQIDELKEKIKEKDYF